jgi:hypothetical protein
MDLKEKMEQYRTQGYFIADDAVEPDMLAPLLEAARRVRTKARSGQVDIFTQWAAPGEPWAIRGLFSLEYGESIFAEYLVSRPVMDYVQAFLGSELRMGDVLLFTNPTHADFSTGWHRDFGSNKRDGTEEEELEILNRPMTHLKWHLALLDDSCLMLVPGSHRRYRTDYEQECMQMSQEYRQYLAQDRPQHQVEMPDHPSIPGQKVIELKAGQAVFWSGNTIHRGATKRDVERLTLAGSWGKHREGDAPAETPPSNRWMLAEGLRDALPDAMRPYYDRWRALQKSGASGPPQ